MACIDGSNICHDDFVEGEKKRERTVRKSISKGSDERCNNIVWRSKMKTGIRQRNNSTTKCNSPLAAHEDHHIAAAQSQHQDASNGEDQDRQGPGGYN